MSRVAFFQEFVREHENKALELDTIQAKINEQVPPISEAQDECPEAMANCNCRFVHQYDEEYEEAKKARRPGRPPSSKEDLLKMKIDALQKEYRDGFCKRVLS